MCLLSQLGVEIGDSQSGIDVTIVVTKAQFARFSAVSAIQRGIQKYKSEREERLTGECSSYIPANVRGISNRKEDNHPTTRHEGSGHHTQTR